MRGLSSSVDPFRAVLISRPAGTTWVGPGKRPISGAWVMVLLVITGLMAGRAAWATEQAVTATPAPVVHAAGSAAPAAPSFAATPTPTSSAGMAAVPATLAAAAPAAAAPKAVTAAAWVSNASASTAPTPTPVAAPAAPANPAPPTAAQLASQAAAQAAGLALVHRVQDAAAKLNYAGVFTYEEGGDIQSSRIVHQLDAKGLEHDRVEALDGKPTECLRTGSEVRCLYPDRKLVMIQEPREDSFPGLLIKGSKDLGVGYKIHVEPAVHRIAGRNCHLIDIQPRDKLRYAYRVCADVDTNLMLKSQMLDTSGHVLAQVSFTAVNIGQPIDADQLASRWDTRQWKVLDTDMSPVDLAAQGWHITLPQGFFNVMQVSRTLDGGDTVRQVVISDGLAAVSIFLEPYNTERNAHQPHGGFRHGALSVYGTRIGDTTWMTALGEVPLRTLDMLAKNIHYTPPETPKQ